MLMDTEEESEMVNIREIAPDMYWVGASDHRLQLFENIHPIPRGVSYNAYVVLDEKNVLLDTVDWSVCPQFLENLEAVLQGKELDAIIVHHVEPDHLASLGEVLLRYPSATVYASAKALEMMDKKLLSVLTGGAGTGKTTVVRSFLSSEKIKAEGVLLLAPTGKARVRLSNMAENVSSKTIAQFLTSLGAFDFENMKPCLTENSRKYSKAKNIIIDECSMLTTDMLYTLIKSLDMTSIKRIILIGDPYQLPPIGPGRPFSDLCHYLNRDDADANLKSAITYLRTVVRTIASGDSDVLTLASWFSGNKPEKFADEMS